MPCLSLAGILSSLMLFVRLYFGFKLNDSFAWEAVAPACEENWDGETKLESTRCFLNESSFSCQQHYQCFFFFI